ncbi:MAG: phosphoribosyl-AMP cyclohydrolase [Bifidobacteriaceae bacterium]|jgi:phosphoribosyl-AMP cyclohydrolase|nr:phosphoribosyl-AMP cyclohydrolase [Bifidobacteriaceae bacterium]
MSTVGSTAGEVAGAGGFAAGAGAAPLPVEDQLKYNADGLIPAIVQRQGSGEVLMLGNLDREAVHRTLTTGRVWYWSRSRQEYWRKGDTSGHVQYVKAVAVDCDADTLLVTVDQVGPACHTGTSSCFTGRAVPAALGGPPAG